MPLQAERTDSEKHNYNSEGTTQRKLPSHIKAEEGQNSIHARAELKAALSSPMDVFQDRDPGNTYFLHFCLIESTEIFTCKRRR